LTVLDIRHHMVSPTIRQYNRSWGWRRQRVCHATKCLTGD